jgi:hypothetical protein
MDQLRTIEILHQRIKFPHEIEIFVQLFSLNRSCTGLQALIPHASDESKAGAGTSRTQNPSPIMGFARLR